MSRSCYKNTSSLLRERLIDRDNKKVLISNLDDSVEAKDNYTIINCNGYGRIRVFKNFSLHLFDNNLFHKPLFRNYPPSNEFRSQVFQIAGCNWRCWYCYVDFKLLDGDYSNSRFFRSNELIDLFLSDAKHPDIIDLSGGQPDLVPEWLLWFLEAIEKKGLMGKVYIWSDDNLSSFFLWEYLTKKEIDYISKFPLYSKIGCIKGYNEESFCFNTGAKSNDFENQFSILSKLIESGFDMYSYITFTTPSILNLDMDIDVLVKKLIRIHPLLPLRIIPLKISKFSNTTLRCNSAQNKSLNFQFNVVKAWENALLSHFTIEQIQQSYSENKLT
jgi:uncharacterized Fe-S cluster-containing radical SAM superfamily protein